MRAAAKLPRQGRAFAKPLRQQSSIRAELVLEINRLFPFAFYRVDENVVCAKLRQVYRHVAGLQPSGWDGQAGEAKQRFRKRAHQNLECAVQAFIWFRGMRSLHERNG